MDLLYRALGIGLEAKDLSFRHVALRAIVVFFASLLMVRLAKKRFLPHKTAFDAILFFVLASMLSRAINGSAAFFPTLGAGFLLIILHRIIAVLACRFHQFGKIVKGTETILVKDGRVLEGALLAHSLSESDLLEQMRLNAGVENPDEAKEARYERSGEISVIRKKQPGTDPAL